MRRFTSLISGEAERFLWLYVSGVHLVVQVQQPHDLLDCVADGLRGDHLEGPLQHMAQSGHLASLGPSGPRPQRAIWLAGQALICHGALMLQKVESALYQETGASSAVGVKRTVLRPLTPPAVRPLRPGEFILFLSTGSFGSGTKAGVEGNLTCCRSGAATAGASTPFGGICFVAAELPKPWLPPAGPADLHWISADIDQRCDRN